MKRDELWFEDLLTATEKLTKPYVYTGKSFNSDLLSHHDVRIILQTLAMSRDPQRVTRVYIDGGERPDYHQQLINKPPLYYEDLYKWAYRLFEEKKFGVIINHAEQFNDALSQRVAAFIEPLILRLGLPLGGIQMAFFLGNYGYTPFGVHRDRDEHSILHFHLGPGIKDFILWDMDSFKSATGSSIEPYFGSLHTMPTCSTYTLRPNSLFVLPANYFHIGNTQEFSITMALAMVNVTNTQLAERSFQIICQQLYSAKTVSTLEFDSIDEQDLLTSNQIFTAGFDKEYGTLTLKDAFKIAIQDYRLSLLSNMGFTYSPSPKTFTTQVLQNATITRTRPFKIFWQHTSNGKIAIYTRHHKVCLRFHHYLPEMIEMLNSGMHLATSSLIKPLLAEWTDDAAFYFLCLLLNYGGINIVSEESD